MAPEANPGGHFNQPNPCESLNTQLIDIYNQLNQRKELAFPSYVSLLNCNVLSNISRTIISVPNSTGEGLAIPPEPKITLDFSEESPSLDLNFNIYPTLSGSESIETIYNIVIEAAKFWGVDMSGLTAGSTEFWEKWGQTVNRAAIILENDLVEAMRKSRQSTQAVHDFIPKPGVFLSVPSNATSGLIVSEDPGGEPVGEGPGGDFPEEGGPADFG